MLLLLLFTSFNLAASHDVKRATISCDGLIFHDVYYDRQALLKNLGIPYNLVMHKYSGTLFFSQTIHKNADVDFEIRACNINKKEPDCRMVAGVPGGYAIAYDAGNDDIYFGGHDGLYKYNFLTKQADYFSEKGKSIWNIFIRRNFYYIEYPTQKLHVYQNNGFVKVAEAVNIEIDVFFKSKIGEIYFANKTALYKVEKMNRFPLVLNDDIIVRQISDDTFGDVYICAADGIYLEDRPYPRLKKIAHMDKTFGMTFDERENIIYSDDHTIYKLLPSNKSRLCIDDDKSEDEFEDKKLRDDVIS